MKLTLADLDAEKPENVEDFIIDLGDEQVRLPRADEIPAALFIDLGNASELELASRVLGSAEWQRILNHPSMKLMRLQKLSALYFEYLKQSGLGDLGKAPASQLSSTGSVTL